MTAAPCAPIAAASAPAISENSGALRNTPRMLRNAAATTETASTAGLADLAVVRTRDPLPSYPALGEDSGAVMDLAEYIRVGKRGLPVVDR